MPSVVAIKRSRTKVSGVLRSTHTFTEPSLSDTLYAVDDRDNVGTAGKNHTIILHVVYRNRIKLMLDL